MTTPFPNQSFFQNNVSILQNTTTGTPNAITMGTVAFQGWNVNTGTNIGLSRTATGASITAVSAQTFNAASGYGTHVALNVCASGATTTTEAMRISASGFVGIGTNAPTTTLHVPSGAYITANIGAGNVGVYKNRVINGDIIVDQRSAGTGGAGGTSIYGGNATTYSNPGGYGVDRYFTSVASAFGSVTVQRVSNPSYTIPFAYAYKIQCASTATLTTNSYLQIIHSIEAINVSDFFLGTASAVPISLSCWVYTNVPGTYSLSLRNSAYTYAYVAPFTVASSNTWTQVQIPNIPGPTAGTWLTGEGVIGLRVEVNLVAGATYQTTANTWVASGPIGTSAFTNTFMNSTSNVFYFTGLQCEKGNICTAFEYRPYPIELMLCQRYYEILMTYTYSGTTLNFTYNTNAGYMFYTPFKQRKAKNGTRAKGSFTLTYGITANSQVETITREAYFYGFTPTGYYYWGLTCPIAIDAEI